MKKVFILSLLMALFCMTGAQAQIKNQLKKPVKILVLCTGNTCRSQMAHGFFASYDKNIQIYSGGVNPSKAINPNAVRVMAELGIDISDHTPHNVSEYVDQSWDYVITVCDNAYKTCPDFDGEVKCRMHVGFDDPSEAVGTQEFIDSEYHRVRDEIGARMYALYQFILTDQHNK